MSGPTPDVTGDLIALIVASAVAKSVTSVVTANIYPDGEEKPGAGIVELGTWVKFMREQREDYDYDGAIRYHTFQVKRRVDLVVDKKCQAARVEMTKIADALQKTGAWIGGVSGAHYMDALVDPWPRVYEEHYVIFDVTISFDTPSTL